MIKLKLAILLTLLSLAMNIEAQISGETTANQTNDPQAEIQYQQPGMTIVEFNALFSSESEDNNSRERQNYREYLERYFGPKLANIVFSQCCNNIPKPVLFLIPYCNWKCSPTGWTENIMDTYSGECQLRENTFSPCSQ